MMVSPTHYEPEALNHWDEKAIFIALVSFYWMNQAVDASENVGLGFGDLSFE